MNITSDLQLLDYLSAKARQIGPDVEMIASARGDPNLHRIFLVAMHTGDLTLYSGDTTDEAIARYVAAKVPPAQVARRKREEAAQLIAEAAKLESAPSP